MAGGLLGAALTALPLLPSNEAWIRVWEFPRVQIAVLLLVSLAAAPLVLPLRKWFGGAFAALVSAALVWQAYSIWPYTPLVATEAKAAGSCDADSRIRLLVANVLIGNEDTGALFEEVRHLEPDLILLVETDRWWDRHLNPLTSTYPHVIGHPKDSGYGMHLFSRFELIEPELRFLVQDYVPSIKTGLRLPSGAEVDFYGLHPEPPPRQDTARRDAELLIVAREVRDEAAQAIVAGDLNDVAWSQTNQLFQEVSGLLDPRIGRGTYATFNANWPLLRWPLDHVFFEESFRLLELAVVPDIGSDHFPIFVAVCHHPPSAGIQDQPEPEPSDLEAAREAIREGREEAQEE